MNQPWTRFLPAFLREKIEGREYLQNVVSNTGWVFADNILRMGVGLFVGVWFARYLGPGQYGLFSYALAFVTLFSAFSSLGLDDIVVRNMVRVLKLGGSVVTLIAATASIMVLRPTDRLSHWLVGVIAAGSLFQSFNVIEFWFNSRVQAKYTVIARNAAFIICSALKIILIMAKASLIAFALVSSIEIVTVSAGLIIAYRSRGHRIRTWRVSKERARKLFKDCWPLACSTLIIMIYMRIDQVMLGEMIGSEEVGIYSVAVRLAELWTFIPMAIFWSVFPSIVEARAVSDELFYARLQKLYNLMVLVALAIAIPVTLLSSWLVKTLFGVAYSRAGHMLMVLIWANLFMYLEFARSSFLTAMNWTRIYLLTVFMGGILNIILNLFLIPRYGGMGAAVASLIGYWFAAHGSCFLFKPLLRTGIMMTKAIAYPRIW